jgi:dihydrolipoamide dehydrogenase
MTEDAARAAGHALKIGRFPFAANGKAIARGEDQGFVKTIWDGQSGRLLGVHMIGPDVTELLATFLAGMTGEFTEAEFLAIMLPHPTLGEAMAESVMDAFGRAIHM